MLSPPHLTGPCVSPSHVPGPVIAAISCGDGGATPVARAAARRRPHSAALSGCPRALCLLQTGKLGQEVRHFPEDYVPWQFKNVGAHLSISVTNRCSRYLGERAKAPALLVGWQKCVCSGCCFVLQSKPSSQLSGSSCPCAPGASQLHTGSSPSLVKKQESLLVSRTSASGARSRGGLGIASSPGCTEWSLWTLQTLKTRVCLIKLLLITRHSPFGGCRKDPRGFEEAVVAPERALEMVWDDSR